MQLFDWSDLLLLLPWRVQLGCLAAFVVVLGIVVLLVQFG